jgi:prepilin-type N-terminal cleavage/methylation domain-containing protein
MMIRPQKQKLGGFSLIELLTAMTITSILMLGLFSLVGQSSTNYRLSQRKVTTLSDTRAFLHYFQSDLTSRVADTKFFYQSNPTGDSIAFIRSNSIDEISTTGDLTASIYYIAFTADGRKGESPKLFRRSLNPEQTQLLIKAGLTAAFPTTDPTVDEVVLYNVVAFRINAQQRNAAGTMTAWLPTSNNAPSLLELTLEITDDLSAQRLLTTAAWTALATSTIPQQREAVKRFVHNIPLTP